MSCASESGTPVGRMGQLMTMPRWSISITCPVLPKRMGEIEGEINSLASITRWMHADRFIADAIHNGKRDADDIGLGTFVEMHIFDEELADPLMGGAFPPDRVFIGKRRHRGQRGNQIALHVGEVQHLGGRIGLLAVSVDRLRFWLRRDIPE